MKAALLLVIVAAALGCNRAPAEGSAQSSSGDTNSFCGMCDASAVIALDEDLFVVADDEDSVMRVFSRKRGGVPVHRLNLTSFLGFSRDDEADIEGTARLGENTFWITSHGNNRKGREQESRQRFFAVRPVGEGMNIRLEPVGRPYTRLLDDLLAEPRMRDFDLQAAANLPPKTAGAINIEALAPTKDGQLLIGFRNPVPRGQALLVPLLNPTGLLTGEPARFGNPQLLQLGGKGIRSMEAWNGGYLIIAGSVDGKGKSSLYFWKGDATQPTKMQDVDFSGLNPEAIATIKGADREELLVVSDDGTRMINGVECKKLTDPMLKRFRAVTVPLNP